MFNEERFHNLITIANERFKEKYYWLEKLSGDLVKAAFPYDRKESAADKRRLETVEFKLENALFQRLMEITRGADYTLLIILITGLAGLMYKYTGNDDIIIGTPIVKEDKDIQAKYINLLLPLRQRFNQRMSFKEMLITVRQTFIEANENQNYPLEVLIHNLDLEYRENDGFPLFDILILLENIQEKEYTRQINTNMVFCFWRLEEFIVGELEFNSSLYKPTTIKGMVTRFTIFLQHALGNVDEELGEIEIMSREERQDILYHFNDISPDYPQEKTLHELFGEQVERAPDYIALVGPSAGAINESPLPQITYRELNERANRLADALKGKNIPLETIVGIIIGHSLEMIMIILGILKADCAYMSIDPIYPPERINYMLADSGIGMVITDNATAEKGTIFSKLKGGEKIASIGTDCQVALYSFFPAHLATAVYSPSNSLAYVIYTSGSTGKPKGALIEQRNVVRLLFNDRFAFDFTDRDIWTMFHSYSFDFSVWEMYGALLYGGKLVLISPMMARDTRGFHEVLKRQGVTILNQTPAAFYNLAEMELLETNKELTLKYVIFGGEALNPIKLKDWKEKYPGVKLINMYGITETTVHVTYKEITDHDIRLAISNIGKPIPTTVTYVLDRDKKLVPVGLSGELYVGGEGVGRGYLNRPELTFERFERDLRDLRCRHDEYHWPYMPDKPYILYKTGDLGRWLVNGELEYLGRIDNQVKVRGYRVELGEIESRLVRHKEITEAVVVLKKNAQETQLLAAYFVSSREIAIAEIREYLSKTMPDYMVPSYFVRVEKIPLTPNGKVDRKALPEPDLDIEEKYEAQLDEIEKKLKEIWSEVLGRKSIGIDDNFFDIGGDSFNIIKVIKRLKEAFKKEAAVVDLFRYTTIRSLAQFLQPRETGPDALKKGKREKRAGLDIAVIGMAGRFPGANDIHEFWDNLINGRESIAFFSDEELTDAGVKSDIIKDPGYVKAGPVLTDTCYFDAMFFGYSPAEAEVMVPQARIFHECAWAALEDAGYDPLAYEGDIGCYVGSSSGFTWQAYSFLTGKYQALGDWPSLLLSSKDNLGTHLAYKLDLSGPCFTFSSACSTSLVAVHLGSRALLTGECRMALVGGITLDTIGKPGYLYQEGMINSPDGHCRAFARDAAGTIFGEGAGAAVLKRYREALDDKDHIYAVIKGSAVNNDGLRKVGYTAPGSRGQQQVVELALKAAKVNPETITFLETHGTGTGLGDPVEIQALTEAFNTDKKQFCAIASVKSNIGHLDIASGIAGFIKTVLALYHGFIPPSLHFDSPNPAIDFGNSPFYVNTELKQWTAEFFPLRAGVSSFGIGGTNAHVVLEEWPDSHSSNAWRMVHGAERKEHGVWRQGRGRVSPPAAPRQYQLILLSARTTTALEKMTQNLAKYLKENQNKLIEPTGPGLAEVAFTLQKGRRVFQHRRMMVCSSIGAAIDVLTHPDDAKIKTFGGSTENPEPRVVFMFPGLGSQYVNMARELYDTESIFHQEMDRCFEILNPIMGYDLKEILYPPPYSLPSDINQPEITQLVIFILEYALARLLINWGITPDALIGYSFGEYAAACVSGVFSLEDALKLVAARGRLVRQVEPGAMLSVPVSKQELKQLLQANQELGLSLAIDNGLSCIAAGSNEAIDVFEKRLKEKKLLCMRVPVSRAFHSPMMAAIAMEFQEVVASLTARPPQIPYVSNVTGTWIRIDQALDPGYWAIHLQQPVCFADGLNLLVNQWKNVIFLELGPGRNLSALIARAIENNPEQRVLNLVRSPQKQVSDLYFLLNQVGRLWLYGKIPDWDRLYPNENRQRISLPTYPFDPHYYPSRGDPLDIGTQMLSLPSVLEKRSDISSWFYIPSWKRSLLPSPVILPTPSPGCWLIFVDPCGLGNQLAEKLENQKQQVIRVSPDHRFSKTSQREYTISPGQPDHYRDLLQELHQTGNVPGKILHLWSVSDNDNENLDKDIFNRAQQLGLYSLVHLAAAIGRLQFSSDFEIIIISNHIQEVTGRENLAPEKSTVMAVAKVIPQEYPYIICRVIDVVLEEPGTWRQERMLAQLQAELCTASNDTVIAYRDGYRWIQVYEPVRLEEIPGDMHDIPGKRLRTKGVYLITGGLGGLGLTLAGYLARSSRAKLALTTRSFFPPRQEWDQWLGNHGENHTTSIRIRKIKELEKAGAEVRVFSVDAADEEGMKQLISLVEQQWGPINGVIHAANKPGGITSYTMIDKIDKIPRPVFQEQFQAKVYGLLVLEKLLRNKPLDFCLLTSSLSSLLGGVGFAAYSAANQFMDSFVYKHNRGNPPAWISLNWGDWQPWNQTDQESIIGGTVNQFNMIPREGIETFRRILYYIDTNQVVVSSGDLQGRIEQWVKLKTLRDRDEDNKPGLSPVYRRSHLSDTYIAPRDPWEQTLVDIWQRLFGFDRIGIRDDFFELGGDSLKAITLAAKIHHQLKVEIPLPEFFERTTIENLAVYAREQSVDKHEDADVPLETVENREYYLLSPAQERLFILQQMQKDFTGYNDQMAFVMEGIFNKDRLERAFRAVIQRHESLRTSFYVVHEAPVQKVHHEVEFEIEYYRNQVSSFIRPFDLSRPPLLRVGLVELPHIPTAPRSRPSQEGKEHKYILMIDMHHIVFDGTSVGILLDEVTRLYNGRELPRLKLQYKDFSTWQNQLLKTGKIKNQEQYWLNLYKDSPDIPGLNLPYDYPRPHVMNFAGDYYRFRLKGEEVLRFKALAAENDATLYMNLLAALNVLLYKYTGQDDIIVGSAIVGRPRQDLQPIIGMFVNTLALRGRPGQCQNYLQWLLKVKAACIKAYENQDLQFEDLVHRLNLQRDPSRNPLFDVCFAFQNFEQPHIQLSEITFTPYELKNKTSRFDLTVLAWEKPGEIVFGVEYCTGLFKLDTIRRFAGHLLEVSRQVSRAPGIPLAHIEILTAEEKQQHLYDFNDTARDYPVDQTIHRLFAEQAAENPDHAALVGQSARRQAQSIERNKERHAPCAMLCAITYRELSEKSGQLARVLKEKGVQPDTIVCIMAGRSIEMVIGILAILKAGAAYLSIDAEYPQKRIQWVLADSSAGVLLTTPKLQVKAEIEENFRQPRGLPLQLINIDENLAPTYESFPSTLTLTSTCQVSPANLAYVIYTSGSTGIPKGVTVVHRSVVRLVKNTNYMEFKPGQRILPTSALEFDASTFEIWGALLNGLTLYLAPKEVILTPGTLKQAVNMYNISTMLMTSPLFNRMVLADPGIFAGLKDLLVGADVLSPLHINQVRIRYPGIKIINGYGPTENTTISTTFLIDKEYKTNIPIGKPIANSTAYIVDKYHKLQPINVPGELWVGGDGVSRGYMNDPGLTCEKFDRDLLDLWDYQDEEVPFGRILNAGGEKKLTAKAHQQTQRKPHSPIYRTGDLARRLPDGNIEFLGRIDQQVKIRGFRIELGEIESLLLKHDEIKEAVVLTGGDEHKDKYLCAYIVVSRLLSVSELREYLAINLPEYMIPSYMVTLEKIPLTPNGKVDRKALPVPAIVSGQAYIAPRDRLEKKLLEIWSGILARDSKHASQLCASIGIDDNFFELGGHSLKATLLVSKIHKEMEVKIPLAKVFKNPTIRGMARYMESAGINRYAAIEPGEKKEYYALSSSQMRLYIIQQMNVNNIAYNMSVVFESKEKIQKEKLERTFKKLIMRHTSFRTSFHPVGGTVVQQVSDHCVFEIEYHDKVKSSTLTTLSADEAIGSFIRPFDLGRAPLLRAGILKTANPGYLFIVDMHHIISDGISLAIMAKEFKALYAGEELGELRIQYKDYSEWLTREEQKKAIKKQEEFWNRELGGDLPLTNIPTDFPRLTVLEFKGSTLNFCLEEETPGLNAMAKKENVTFFMLLLAVFNILLARIGHQEDIIVGTAIANRDHADLHPLIGFMANSLVLRNFPRGHKTFREFLKEVRQRALDAFENRDYPFMELAGRLDMKRYPGRSPIFDVQFQFDNIDIPIQNIPGTNLTSYNYRDTPVKLDLMLSGKQSGNKLIFNLTYNANIFKEKTIKKFSLRFKQIISAILEDPVKKLSEIETESQGIKQELISRFTGNLEEE